MSDARPPDPLPDDLDDLLAAERRRPSTLPPDVSDRVLERVRARVVEAPPAAPRGRSLAREALTAVVGAVLGAGLHAAVRRPPPPRTVVVERVVERRVEVPTVRYVTVFADAGAAVAERDASTAPRVAPLGGRASIVADDNDGALVERARVALLRRNPSDALAAVQEHARRFPRGEFAEEREVLAVQCLVALGRSAEATARAEAFHRRFPQSALGAAVDAAVAR